MLKKRLGLEAIELDNIQKAEDFTSFCFKIPTVLIIPEGCVKIGKYVFWGCEELEKVVIPESVERIEEWAFEGCEKAVIILKKPRSEFKYIASTAFYLCRNVYIYVKEEIRN